MQQSESAPGSASHSRHSPKATETPLVPQAEQSPELQKQIIPFIVSGHLPRRNGHFQMTQQNLETTGFFTSPGMIHNPVIP